MVASLFKITPGAAFAPLLSNIVSSGDVLALLAQLTNAMKVKRLPRNHKWLRVSTLLGLLNIKITPLAATWQNGD
tara:strand:- start:12624 stop:12848 length:225 start_codon:yes stop_codon:yes gene_type:complete